MGPLTAPYLRGGSHVVIATDAPPHLLSQGGWHERAVTRREAGEPARSQATKSAVTTPSGEQQNGLSQRRSQELRRGLRGRRHPTA